VSRLVPPIITIAADTLPAGDLYVVKDILWEKPELVSEEAGKCLSF
jgi:hypothetical protein